MICVVFILSYFVVLHAYVISLARNANCYHWCTCFCSVSKANAYEIYIVPQATYHSCRWTFMSQTEWAYSL